VDVAYQVTTPPVKSVVPTGGIALGDIPTGPPVPAGNDIGANLAAAFDPFSELNVGGENLQTGLAPGLGGSSWWNILKIAGLSGIAGGFLGKLGSTFGWGGGGNGGSEPAPGQDIIGAVSGVIPQASNWLGNLPDWAKGLIGGGAGAALGAGIATIVNNAPGGGQDMDQNTLAQLALVFGALPVSGWNTNPVAPEYGQQFFRLSNGRIGTITKRGMVKTWRPYRPIVLGKKPDIYTLLRVNRKVDKTLKKVKKAVK